MARVILIALDSVGIDPLGHGRPESVYAGSRFLFPAGRGGELIPLPDAPVPGALAETDVAGGAAGAIECAITYASIFSGQSALDRHGLMQGMGLKERALRELVAGDNLFRRFRNPCLANAIFPLHLAFLGSSYVQDLLPACDLAAAESALRFGARPVCLRGPGKHGFAELFTLGEINQNIFVYAAREAGVPRRTWADVRRGLALTGTMTHELEAAFNWEAFGEAALPLRTPEETAAILVDLAREHDFTFYKYQLADLVSHTRRVDIARAVFATIESFVGAVLGAIDPAETVVIVTSDHGHLEQVGFTRGHPKSKVPTWYFGPDAEAHAGRMRRPEGIFHVVAGHAAGPATIRGKQGMVP
ncbi:MAG TPA: hypothetical protein VIL46_14835 [Gemmataceae bacterium]